MALITPEFKAWFFESLSSDGPKNLWQFRGNTIGFPLLMTTMGSLGCVIFALRPSDEFGPGWFERTGSVAIGAFLVAVTSGLWLARPWARWAFGGMTLLLWLVISVDIAKERIGEPVSWRVGLDVLKILLIFFCAIGIFAPDVGRSFARARGWLADRERATRGDGGPSDPNTSGDAGPPTEPPSPGELKAVQQLASDEAADRDTRNC